tara:strand:- start:57 stop:326 length:270 start_codon:yes stop_codon:yes gene_type:complete
MPKLLADIKDNKLYLDQDYESYEALKELEGKRVEVTIKLWRNTLTRRQQKYYRGALLPFSVKVFNDAGIMIIDEDEMHEVYKKHFGVVR